MVKVSLVSYWTKHRPTLERARTDLQIAMFGELQRETPRSAASWNNVTTRGDGG